MVRAGVFLEVLKHPYLPNQSCQPTLIIRCYTRAFNVQAAFQRPGDSHHVAPLLYIVKLYNLITSTKSPQLEAPALLWRLHPRLQATLLQC
ncbi:hypothetical protein T07_1678 [Trichinella nelsoni]|uniref:Uncharacterized protein n=1 Tax=Trichinella nelsoni TaxID=6336 RepID=A0A0V0RM02_9BILA|nr:hypothetical protein T07_1678 [Trichinella nelsoni]